MNSQITQNYIKQCETVSDINEHLPTLNRYAQECDSIVECGVRNIVSSYAFAQGLLDRPNSLTLIDPYKSPNIDTFLEMCAKENVNAKFIHDSDIKCKPVPTDLLFIDTWHVYGHLKRELEYWHSFVNKYIILHDTTVDADVGESIRNGWDCKQQSIESGIPEAEIRKGLWPAVEEFVAKYEDWVIFYRFTNNNGLTVLRRIE